MPPSFVAPRTSGSPVVHLQSRRQAPGRRRALTSGAARGRPRAQAQLWDAETGQRIGGVIEQDGLLRTVRFSDDSRLLVLGDLGIPTSKGSTMQLHDATTALPHGPPLKLPKVIMSAALSPDGTTLATGMADQSLQSGQFQLWDAATLRPRCEPISVLAPVNSLAFTPRRQGRRHGGRAESGDRSARPGSGTRPPASPSARRSSAEEPCSPRRSIPAAGSC